MTTEEKLKELDDLQTYLISFFEGITLLKNPSSPHPTFLNSSQIQLAEEAVTHYLQHLKNETKHQ